MLTFILRRVRASTVFLAPYEKLQRKLLKAALGLFGSADNAPRVQVGWAYGRWEQQWCELLVGSPGRLARQLLLWLMRLADLMCCCCYHWSR